MNYSLADTQTEAAEKARTRLAPRREDYQGADVLVRFTWNGTIPQFQGLMPTEDALDVARRLHRTNEVLADAVVGCARYMDYSDHYAQLLSGQVSEEDFQAIASRYAVAPTGDIVGLAERIAIILRETRVVFPPERLEEMCSATSSEVEAALSLLAERGYILIE